MSRSSLLFILATFFLCHTAIGKDPFTKNELPNGMGKNATLRLADRYYAESIFYTAADNYKLYLTKKPNDRYARYWLAMALYQARDYKGAEDNFAAFYDLKPRNTSSLVTSTTVWRSTGMANTTKQKTTCKNSRDSIILPTRTSKQHSCALLRSSPMVAILLKLLINSRSRSSVSVRI